MLGIRKINVYAECYTPTGNSWGTNKDGTSCTGCGAQEEFYGCADVAITSSLQRQEDSVEVLHHGAPTGEETPTAFIPQEMATATTHQVEPETAPVVIVTESASRRAASTDDCVAGPGYEGNAQMDRLVFSYGTMIMNACY